MLNYWQPGTQYNYDAVVLFEGVQYKIIQPHRSQSDWAPPATPALWGRLEGGGYHSPHHEKSGEWDGECQTRPHHEKSGEWDGDCKTQPCAPSCDQSPQQPQQQQQQQQPYQAPSGGVTPTEAERKKHWYDLDDKRKTELEVGGGILAGVGAIAAGYYAYQGHNKNEEEKKAHLWSLNSWLKDAEQRTQAFRSGNYPGPVAWVLNQGKDIPRDAIQGGFERGAPLYICRAYYEGGIMIGKACSVFKKGAVIGFKKDEIHLDKYEILVGNSDAVRWVNISGKFNLASLGGLRPVEGVREPGGAPQYIAQAPYHGAVHPGKACEDYGNGCFIPYDSTEKKIEEYAVLCYNN